MLGAVNNAKEQRFRPRSKPFESGRSGNPRGRPKGSRNKRTIADQEIIASGMSPLAFLCSVFRDPKQPMKRRIEAAKSAAAYVYPKLAVTSFSPLQWEAPQDNTIKVVFVDAPTPEDD
jgi:hypothetical protein